MEYKEEVQELRAELLDLERTHKKLSYEVAVKRLEKVNNRLNPILDAHRKELDDFQATIQKEINSDDLKAFSEQNRAVTRLQMKYYQLQVLLAAHHS